MTQVLAPIALRKMTMQDQPAVLQWVEDSDPHAWSARAISDSLLTGHICWVAVTEATPSPVGLAIFQQVLDEAELLYIVVRSDQQKQGVGQQILSLACADLTAQSIQQVHLEVRETNHSARRLYKRLGFQEVGRRKAYYPLADGGREDALLMGKALQPC